MSLKFKKTDLKTTFARTQVSGGKALFFACLVSFQLFAFSWQASAQDHSVSQNSDVNQTRSHLAKFVARFGQTAKPAMPEEFNETFGAEWEFLRADLKPGPKAGLGGMEVTAAKEVAEYFRTQFCPPGNCEVEEVKIKWDDGEFKVKFPSGNYFIISYDPACIEIQPKYGDMKFWEANEGFFQEVIFDQLAKLKFSPKSTPNISGGGFKTNGHLNAGFKSISKGDLAIFAQFFFDFLNHTELSFGALGRDEKNAPHPLDFSRKIREELKKIQIEIQSGKIATIEDFQKAIHERVYIKTKDPDFKGTFHYQAFNIQNLRNYLQWGEGKDLPIELRPIRGQHSAHEFVLLAKFFQARMRLLRAEKIPLWYDLEQEAPKTDHEVVNRFYVAVVEAGLDWNQYKVLMPEELQRVPVSGFYEGRWEPESRETFTMIKKNLRSMINSPFIRKRIMQIVTNPRFLGTSRAEDFFKEMADFYESLEAEEREIQEQIPAGKEIAQSWAARATKWLMVKLKGASPGAAESYLSQIQTPRGILREFMAAHMSNPNVQNWKRFGIYSTNRERELFRDVAKRGIVVIPRCEGIFN